MRILRVITRLPPGGIEQRLLALLPDLRRRGIEAQVVCLHERGALADQFDASGIPVTLLKLASRLNPRGIVALARFAQEQKIDLIHSHMYRANTPATLAGWWSGIPVVGQVHNIATWETRRQRWMDGFLARRRVATIAVAERVANDIRQTLGLPADKVRVIYNGIDLEKFRPARSVDERQDARASLGVLSEEVAVVCPARLHPQKNHEALIAAFASLPDGPPAALFIVGDGPQREHLANLVAGQSLATNRRIVLAGFRADMPTVFRASDVVALVSFKEGFSNAIVEAMAASCAIMATDVGGNAEALADGSGVILNSTDASDIRTSLDKLIADSSLRASLAQSAHARSQRYSLAAMSDATEQLYREALGR